MSRILTGLKPTGDLTLGNLMGSIKPMIRMQDDGEDVFLFVADLHALTVKQDSDELKERIKRFVAMYIACGIDPNKTTIYLQSDNYYIPAISWLLECTTYYGEASRMIQFKEKSKNNDNFSVGLFTYPILMASDILYCDAKYVPVGIDQKQHVELARDIAIRFNKTYGDTFFIPDVYITKNAVKVTDLKFPTKKMSKSEGNNQGVISLFDSKEEITKKIMGATTDSDSKVYYDEENKPGISNLMNILSFVDNVNIDDIEKMFIGKGYGDFKKYVAERLSNYIGNIQDKYEMLINSGEIDKILDEGAKKTNEIAKNKYQLMREKMGVIR